MKRIVLDTSVVVSALRSRHGASRVLLDRVAEGRLIPLVTTALFLEYEDVLKRPVQMVVHGLDEQSIDAMLAELAALSEPVDLRFQWRPQVSDPADEMVLEAAVNGRADALVTHNVRDFERAAAIFGLRLFRPGDFLRSNEP